MEKKEKVEVKDDYGRQINDKEGNPLFEEVEKTMPGYKVGYVFAYEDGQIGEAAKIRQYSEVMKNNQSISQEETRTIKHSIRM